MTNVNTFVFRIAADSEYVKKEFEQGRLRQGWGNSDSYMRLEEKEWVNKQCQRDPFANNDSYYTRKYNNHKILLEIKAGDILIIPKLSHPSQFTVCRAAGGYEFLKPDGFDGDDFYHTIPIERTSVRQFDYHADETCENIRAKLRAYQSPLNHVWNQTVQDCAERLLQTDSNIQGSEISAVIEEIKSDARKGALQRFRDLGNKNIEKIVGIIFEKLGYELIGKNSYDKKGGDADLIYISKSVSEFFEVSANGTDIVGQKIYVQIKNKSGIDTGDTEGLEQLKQRTLNEPGAVKILLSTADKFTEECKKIALENNILLIDSDGFLNIVFKYTD